MSDWTPLDAFLSGLCAIAARMRTNGAGERIRGQPGNGAREGVIDIRQDRPFAPLMMRDARQGCGWPGQ
jgi:hypothetical protein